MKPSSVPFFNLLQELRDYYKQKFSVKDVAIIGGIIWRCMTKEERRPYVEMAKRSKKCGKRTLLPCTTLVTRSSNSYLAYPERAKIFDFLHCSSDMFHLFPVMIIYHASSTLMGFSLKLRARHLFTHRRFRRSLPIDPQDLGVTKSQL
ncbi:hypothetical protein AAG570_013626 [Ranatra chinensis]|uniref:HMG box domain-containing protein n=1 Tax=Ranatra chinensis TaxID=642074 RepID=A0ABD0YCR4_9HEMI